MIIKFLIVLNWIRLNNDAKVQKSLWITKHTCCYLYFFTLYARFYCLLTQHNQSSNNSAIVFVVFHILSEHMRFLIYLLIKFKVKIELPITQFSCTITKDQTLSTYSHFFYGFPTKLPHVNFLKKYKYHTVCIAVCADLCNFAKNIICQRLRQIEVMRHSQIAESVYLTLTQIK